jgi:hypothetical protein
MDHLALAQDKIDHPLCDGCGERTWRGDLSDEPDGRFCPDCQLVREDDAEDAALEELRRDDDEEVSA